MTENPEHYWISNFENGRHFCERTYDVASLKTHEVKAHNYDDSNEC